MTADKRVGKCKKTKDESFGFLRKEQKSVEVMEKAELRQICRERVRQKVCKLLKTWSEKTGAMRFGERAGDFTMDHIMNVNECQ
jgi:hypothetical protein